MKQYQRLKKEDNLDKLLRKKRNANTVDKYSMQRTLVNFCLKDDLFELLETVKIGLSILEREGFPIEEFAIFKFNDWTKKNGKKS